MGIKWFWKEDWIHDFVVGDSNLSGLLQMDSFERDLDLIILCRLSIYRQAWLCQYFGLELMSEKLTFL